MTEERPRCNIDDILCQMQALSHLRGLQSAFGDGKFQEKFPDLVGLDDKIVETISRQELELKQSLESCGLANPTDSTITVQPKVVRVVNVETVIEDE